MSVQTPGQQVAEVLADPHAEQSIQGREDDADSRARRVALRTDGRGNVPASELRDGERPAHEAEGLDERRARPDDDRHHRQGR